MKDKKSNSQRGIIYNTLDLIEDLVKEIGSLPKASRSIGYGSTYLSDLKQRMNNPNVRGYNPQYKFSENNLNNFKENLDRNLHNKAVNCKLYIDKYLTLNPSLKKYSNQQYRIDLKADFFSEIDTLEKAYWLGFLYADGEVKQYYRKKPWYMISVELSVKSRDQLERFCQSLGLDANTMIKERVRIKQYKGKWKAYRMAYIRFRCKPMVQDLVNIGFTSSKSLRKVIPQLSSNLDTYPSQNELYLAWVLGYYDGDGQTNSTRISSSSKEFLEQIKSIFMIKYNIKLHSEKGKKSYFDNITSTKSNWNLSLGASLFNKMMKNYSFSMPKKRLIYKEKN